MRRFWDWILDQKTNTVRKWQSVVLSLDRYQQHGGHLKPIGGSDDELEREQRRGSKSLLDIPDNQKSSISLQNFENFGDYKQADFEEFFKESSGAIESALERKHTLSPHYNRRKGSPTPQLSSSPSLDSRSSSFRPRDRQLRPNIRVGSADIDFALDAEDEINDDFDENPSSSSTQRKHSTVPQVSVSFADQSTTSVIEISEEGGSGDAPSSSTARPTASDDSNLETTEARLARYHLTASVESSTTGENEKDKTDEKKKISPLQLRRLSTIQVAQSLSGRRSSTTLLPLTAAQIHLVRTIWRQVYITKGPTVIGSTLLHRIFFKSVKTKNQFSRCPFPHRFPNRDSFNKAHAKATGELLDKIVDNLENLESMSDCLFAVGALHAKIAGQELSRKIWNTMAETFIDCTLEWGDKKGRTETSRKAWALIIAFVIEKIKEGHSHERRRLVQLRRSSWIAAAQVSIDLPPPVLTVQLQEAVKEAGP